MHAIILAGGFGTRLQSVLTHLPKPMAPIDNRPFLAYMLDYLCRQGITHVSLSLHHMHETIQDYFGQQYKNIQLNYLIEPEPLGTGGAIKFALAQIKSLEPVFVLNGDSFLQLNYQAMYQKHKENQANLTIALRYVEDCSRYGKVVVEEEKIVAFKEKGETDSGLINGGVYLMQPTLFAPYALEVPFSFEVDFLLPQVASLKPLSFTTQDYFIDIGIPEDYSRAQTELPALNLC